jgi:hypothetical protein
MLAAHGFRRGVVDVEKPFPCSSLGSSH